MSRFGRTWLSVLAVTAWMAAGGCSEVQTDPRFQQRNAKRQERIAVIFARAKSREAECPERLAHVAQLAEESRVRHERNLDRTLETLKRKWQRDVELWPQRRAQTRAKVAKELSGDPESIDATIPRMFY